MDNQIALVTGANSGTGKATAMAFVKMGIHVVMLCRSKERGEAALQEVLAQGGGSAELMLCDLASMESIRSFCAAFSARYKRLDILVNNAGVITLDRQETADGLELQFGVNHIGHFLLTTTLLPLIKATADARIVIVASGAHKIGNLDFDNIPMEKGYSVFASYGRAKLCNVLFMKELAKRLRGSDTTVNCVHPGAVGSNMGVNRETGFGKSIMKLLRPFFLTPEEGARTAVYVATSTKCAKVTGEYFYKCKTAKVSKRANDPDLAARLWAYSEAVIKK